ncbi:MAG: aminotransferase class I/II-fold pyridoxal phosphate-dependent enzyme [Pseudomonadota bacterium]
MRDFALETYFSTWEFTARYHLTASDAESVTVAELLELAGQPADALGELHLGYTQTWGAPDLREAIAGTYDTLGAENILCFAGAEEGVYAAMRVLLDKDDHAIVVVPNYQAAETVPLDICEVTGVPLDEHDGWRLDPDAVRRAVRPNTRLVSVCFPNNPTGAVPSHADFAALIEVCREHGLYLFSDEVYRGLELDASKRIAQAADAYERGLSLNVMSKAYGLPGLRIGWIASQNKDVLQRLERYKHYLSICNSAPSERLAVIALGVRDALQARIHERMRNNLTALDAFFERHRALFDWSHPDGGCIAYPAYLGAEGVETFCQQLVEETGVLLLPGSIYRSDLLPTPASRFRIGFGRAGMDEGLSAFEAYLEKHRPQVAAAS